MLILCGLAFAAEPPTCPYYPYHDFVWASDYVAPVRPPDTLLDNCQNLGLNNSQLCSVVNDIRLTSNQKKQLILDDFVKNNGFPPFNESETWNGKLSFTKYPPDGTQVSSSTYIKDAWVRILTLNPAVIDSTDNKTYINDTGQLRMAKGFAFVVPKETFSGDCRTEYAVCGYNYALSAYDNGVQLPKTGDTVASYAAPSLVNGARNDFSAVLSINTHYVINHYYLVTRCYGSGKSTFCVTTCEFADSEDRQDSLSVSDAKTAYYYLSNASQHAFVDSYKDGLAGIWLLVSANADFSSIRFSVGNSSLKLQGSQYQLKPDLAPYNALTPLSLPAPGSLQIKGLSILSRENWVISGLHSEKLHLLAPSPDLNCTIGISSHFASQVYLDACHYNATQLPILNLSIANATNASFVAFAYFYDNSTGLPLSGKNLTFSYANQTRSANTGSSGSAMVEFARTPWTSLVSVVFLTDFETKSAKAYAVIPAPEPDVFTYIWYLVLLAFAAWLFYRWARRRLRGIYD